MTQLTQTELKRLVTYDPLTGQFMRIAGKRAGTFTGTVVTNGYVHVYINGQIYKGHRLAWLYTHGNWPKNQIDHINNIRSDNRIDNLRDVTCAINHQNRRRRTNSKSGFLGVTWHKRERKWQAYIEINAKAKHLGLFKCLGQAFRARVTAEKLYHPDRPQ